MSRNIPREFAPAWQCSLEAITAQSLLHAYLALHGGAAADDARSKARCEARTDAAIALLDQATDAAGALTLPPGLYDGFSGISWVTAHLTAGCSTRPTTAASRSTRCARDAP